MRYSKLIASSVLLGAAVLAAVPASAEEVTVKLWARADRSGPLRAGNIVAAAEPLNAALKASGSDVTVKVDVFEGPATGFDADALDILKAFSVGQGPDVYVAAHEWVGEFAKSGYAMDMTDFIAANQWAFGDVVPVLWDATKYEGKVHAVPQDSEIRMFFYNKDMLRKIGKDEAFVEGLPDMVDKGEFTMTDLSNLAKEVVDKGAAEIGIIHRPNAGPDYLMTFASFGAKFMDEQSGKLLLPKAELMVCWSVSMMFCEVARSVSKRWNLASSDWRSRSSLVCISSMRSVARVFWSVRLLISESISPSVARI